MHAVGSASTSCHYPALLLPFSRGRSSSHNFYFEVNSSSQAEMIDYSTQKSKTEEASPGPWTSQPVPTAPALSPPSHSLTKGSESPAVYFSQRLLLTCPPEK